ANGGPKVGACRADSFAADLVHGVWPHSALRGVVRIVAARKADFEAGLDECGLPSHEFVGRMPPNRNRAGLPVPGVVEVQVGLEPLECRQTSFPGPLAQAERGPFVVVEGLTTEGDACIDGG